MKTSIMKTLATSILLATILFTGCKKDSGPVGQTGAQGPAGNANVITTNTITLNSFNYNAATDTYTEKYITTGITQDVLDHGVVMVFVKTMNGWTSLPMAGVLISTDVLRYEEVIDGVNITYIDNSTATTLDPSGSNWVIKVVIIPSERKIPNVKSYADAKAAYNLKD